MRTEPGPPQTAIRPPLTKRLRPVHWIVLDFLVAGAIGLPTLAVLRVAIARSYWAAPFPTGPGLAPLIAVAIAAPVALRRRGPVTALTLLLPVSAFATWIAGGLPTSQPLFFLPEAYVLYLVAATSRRAVAVRALTAVLAVTGAEVLASAVTGVSVAAAVPAALMVIIACTLGYAVRQRRVYAEGLREQAASAAVTEERLRIARELHDVVAHSMTVVAVQAGFGQYVFDDQPAQARAALGAIQSTSREALGEMQRLLGVLRQAAPSRTGPGETGTAASPALAPAPGLADLDRLTARTADAGVRVELRRNGGRRDVPAGIDLSAYRIVQEALTNVVKHAGAASCRVTVTYGESDLSVEITDEGPATVGGALPGGYDPAGAAAAGASGADGGAPGRTGHGIAGMRERALLYGGQFTAEPLPGRGFRVAARFPLDAPGERDAEHRGRNVPAAAQNGRQPWPGEA